MIEVIPAIESLDGYEDHYNGLEGLLNSLDALEDLVADHTEFQKRWCLTFSGTKCVRRQP